MRGARTGGGDGRRNIVAKVCIWYLGALARGLEVARDARIREQLSCLVDRCGEECLYQGSLVPSIGWNSLCLHGREGEGGKVVT